MNKENNKNGKNNGQNFLVGLLILAIITCIVTIAIYTLNSNTKDDDKTISYTDLIKQISDGNIKKVEMITGSTSIKVTLKEKIKDGEEQDNIQESQNDENATNEDYTGKNVKLNKETNLKLLPTFSSNTLSHFAKHFLQNPQFAAQKPPTALLFTPFTETRFAESSL